MSAEHAFRCVETGRPFQPMSGTAIHEVGACRYPQVDGIPSVQTRLRSRAELEAQCEAVRRGGRDAVLNWLRSWAAGWSHDLDALRRVVEPSAPTSLMTDWARYCGDASHYFLVRWGCPSYLSNLAFLHRFAGRRVACLGSGIGHLSNLLAAIRPAARVTILDGNLVHLLVARAYMASGDQAVCAELDDPLPLPDAEFDVVTMNDTFHYVDAQADLLREIHRVLTPDGEALLMHIHDPRETSGETVPGLPVTPVALSRMARAAGWLGVVFHPERALVRRLMEGMPAEESAVTEPDAVPPGPYTAHLIKDVTRPAHAWRLALRRDEMMLNPIYVRRGRDAWRIDWRGSDRNRREFGHTPLPDPLDRRALDGAVADIFHRGLLVPNPDGRIDRTAPPGSHGEAHE